MSDALTGQERRRILEHRPTKVNEIPPAPRSDASARPPWPVVIFTAAYLAASVVGAVLRGNGEFLFYITVMLILVAVVWTVHRCVRLHTATLWGLSIWGLVHMAGGLVVVPSSWPVAGENRVLYSLWIVPNLLKYDQVVHAYGFGISTWVCWQGLRAAVSNGAKILQPTPGLMVLSAAAGMGLGALNEVIEFFATLMVPETNVGGYVNTGWDLVSNLVGSAVAATLIWFDGQRSRE